MKYFLSILFLLFCLKQVSAQEKHFVFIQSETKQPFYVSVNGKLYSSTSSGYLIIPKLAEGNYNVTVGFAQNAYPEQTFNFVIQNKDLGFDLKNFNEKGWALFNLQTLDLTMAAGGNTDVVAKAINESLTAKAPPAVISFTKKKDTSQQVIPVVDTSVKAIAKVEGDQSQILTADSNTLVSSKTASDLPVASSQPPKSDVSIVKTDKPADVKKVSEETGEEGVRLSYVEGSGKTKDTINVMIPSYPATSNTSNTTSSNANAANPKNDVEKQGSQSSAIASTSGDVKFLDINMGNKKDTSNLPPVARETSRIMENSNCKNIATDDDYAKLRKKMAMETTDEKMINEAKKFYRNKCFTTSQIKGLSTLFLSDEGRFKFFDASFVSVADASQYSTLETEFIDPAFVTRFKGLLQ